MRRLIFILPALTLVALIVVFPAVETVRGGLWSWDGLEMTEFAGFENYAELFGSRSFINPARFPTRIPPWGALVHNLVWVVVFIPLTALLGLFLAVLFREVKGGSMLKSMIFLGMVVPLVVGGMMIRFMFDGRAGIVNALLRTVGLDSLARTWTAYPDTALPSVILGSVWIWTGFAMIIYSAGLELIPKDLYESASVDGASTWRTFRRITIPMVKPATLIVVIMNLIYVLRIFDIVYVATRGGPGGASTVLALQGYFYAFQYHEFGMASAVFTFLTIMAAAISVFLVRRVR
ncbi:MAG: sugar ABC transporter permease [Dehalococcoidia bacterium]|nr:sugar ABC transporter permease [Dehalococcoidia bacterium]